MYGGLPNSLDMLGSTARSVFHFFLIALGVKTLPLLLFACVPRKGRLILSAVLSASLVAIFLLLAQLGQLSLATTSVVVATLTYYIVVSAIVFRLISQLQSGALRKDGLFLFAALGYVFLPAFALRHVGGLPMLVFGWKMVFCAYSYGVEAVRFPGTARLSGFMFFLWVDPTFSYPERSRRAEISTRCVLRGVATGTFVMLVGQQIVRHWPRLLASAAQLLGVERHSLAFVALSTLAFFFPVYWLRSGSARLRISLMAAIGFRTPESFKQPHLAASPAEFWRRWNCWVGDWVKRYVFAPLSLWLMRKVRAASPQRGVWIARPFALLISFLVMGALHDWLTWAAQGQLVFVYMKTFAFAALGLLIWELGNASSAGEARSAHRLGFGRALTALYGAAYVYGLMALASPPSG